MQKNIKNAVTEDAIKRLCGCFGLTNCNVKLLGDAQNLVFGVTDNYIMKFIHFSHRSLNQLTAETEFIEHLERHGLGVQHRLKVDGQHYIEYTNRGQQFWVGVENRASGLRPRRKDASIYNDNMIELWGETTAHMHNASECFTPKYSRFIFADDPSIANAEELLRNNCGDYFADDYCNTLKRIMAMRMDSKTFGMVHYDLHYGNFYIDGNRLSIFDFDDCCTAHYISDIAVALFAHCLTDPTMGEAYYRETNEFLTTFMRGYERVRHMDDCFMNTLPLFMRYRYYLLLLFYITDYDIDDTEAIEGKAKLMNVLLHTKENIL